MKSLLSKRPIKYTLITFIAFAVILSLLPIAIKLGAEYAIKEQGAKQVSIDDINLNLFTGKFELKQLKATFNDQPALSLEHLFAELDVSALFQSRIILPEIKISGLSALIKRDDNGAIEINGYKIPASTETAAQTEEVESKPLEFALNTFNLSQSSITYQESGFEQNLTLSSIQISNIKSWDNKAVAKLLVDIKEGETTINAQADLVLFNDVRQVSGSLGIHGLNSQTYKKFHQQHIDQLNAQVDADINFKIDLADSVKGNIEHNITLSKINAHYQKLIYSLESLNTQGTTALNGSDVIVDAELKMDQSQLSDSETSTPLNSFSALRLKGLHYDAKQASFSQLSLKDIDVLENPKKKKLVSLASLVLKEFQFNLKASTLGLALVELQQPDINATLSAEKQITHLALIEPIIQRLKPSESNDAEEINKEPAKPLVININQVRLTKPGMLHFNDLSVDPIYSTDLHFNKIDIDHISSENPAKFKLALKQGEYTTIDINGQGLLFNPVENLSYTVDIKQLDLPPISSYTTKTMGYGVKSGVVDTVIKGSIKKQQIDTNVVLKIDSIEVIETDKETAAEISGASGMSIDLALSTLMDDNNIIDLEMPIGGDIKKPDFDLSLIINKAMGIAMKAASMSYLKHALQPFSSLVTLFSLAKDAASSISLAPITFELNKTDLGAEQKELLDKVTTVLTKRPGIKIKSCGIASLSDQTSIKTNLLNAKTQAYLKEIKGKKIKKEIKEAAINKLSVSDKELHQAMKTLADNRAASVKAYLTQIKKIKPAKILNCLSAENLNKESKPVVELVI